MRNRNQLYCVFLLISIYCFGVAAPLSVGYPSNQVSTVKGKSTERLSSEAGNTIYFAQSSKSSFSGLAESPLQITNLTFFGFWATVFLLLFLLVNARFIQYVKYLYLTLIKQRKAVLIFPFHSFW